MVVRNIRRKINKSNEFINEEILSAFHENKKNTSRY